MNILTMNVILGIGRLHRKHVWIGVLYRSLGGNSLFRYIYSLHLASLAVDIRRMHVIEDVI